MSNVIKTIIITSLLSICVSQEALHNEKSEKGSLSFSAGFIENIPQYDLGLGAELKFGSSKYWVIAYHHSAKLLLINGSIPSYQSFVIGVGYSKINRVVRISSSIGPALVLVTNQSEDVTSFPGININSQIIMTPFRDIGFGVEMNTNLNQNEYIYGIRGLLFFQRTI